MASQRTKWRKKIAENFNRLSRAHEHYRQTDGRTTTYSERERESTFAKNGEQPVTHPLSNYFELHTDGRTRGHSLKLIKHRCKSEVRRHFFSERVVNRWT